MLSPWTQPWPWPNSDSWQNPQHWMGLYPAVVLRWRAQTHTCTHSVTSGQRDDSGCQSPYPIRRVERKSPRLCPLKDHHYNIRYKCIYLWVWTLPLWVFVRWGGVGGLACLPFLWVTGPLEGLARASLKDKHKTPPGMWTSARSDACQDPLTQQRPPGTGERLRT